MFMSLHVPAGACSPVASASPIHVFPIQRVLKHSLVKLQNVGWELRCPFLSFFFFAPKTNFSLHHLHAK